MAVVAVASVVTEKLADMVKNESAITLGKVIEEIIKEVELSGSILSEKEEDVNWGRDYLSILYELEDVVEFTLAVGITRRRRKLSYLNLTLSCKNLRARRKLKRILTTLKNNTRPVRVLNEGSRLKLLSYNKEEEEHEHEQSHHDQSSLNCLSIKSYEADDSEEEQEHSDADADPEIVVRCLRRSRLINQRLTEELYELPENEDTDQEIAMNEIQEESSRTSSSTALGPLSIATSFVRRLQNPKLLFSNSYDEQESAIIDHGQHVHNLVKRLTSSKSQKKGSGDQVISIVGGLGSGKTTLARAVYNSRSIKHYFDCRAWICVPKGYTKTDPLLSILKEFKKLKGLVGRALISEQALEDTLLEHLKDKRYLVVLDDVCEEHVWEKLKNAFPDTRNGSKIIFTTSEVDVAMSANPNSYPYHLKPISDQDSWDMLLNKAGLEETPDISSVKHKILELCKGLPLNIVLVAGLLSTKILSSNRIGDEWLHQVNSWHASCDISAICYNDLPAHSKLCLLYLALFPREFDVPIRRLLRLWLAEGFVRRFQTTTTTIDVAPEDLVQECFDDLVKRNMLQISKLRSDGSSRSCCLPGHLHDKLFPIARDISLFHVYHNSNDDLLGVRRIVEYGDIKDCPLTPSELQKLRSYLSFNIQKKDTPAREVGKFVGKIIGKNGLGLLRVLDLENVYKPSLPENLGDLVHLRYLGLRWTFLDTLPLSIGDLPYLETLDLKHTYIKSLPSSIWKLKHLQHLNLNEIRLDMPQKMPTTSLPPLRTLWGLFVDRRVL